MKAADAASQHHTRSTTPESDKNLVVVSFVHAHDQARFLGFGFGPKLEACRDLDRKVALALPQPGRRCDVVESGGRAMEPQVAGALAERIQLGFGVS